MTNRNNAAIRGDINTPFVFKSETEASLTKETLSLVGYAARGPAFVPQQVNSYGASENILNTWTNIFGPLEEQKEQPGPFAANIWLNNGGNQLSYTRVLGIGDGEGQDSNLDYNLAGFIVGDNILSGSSTYGVKSSNPNSVDNGIAGRTYFVGTIVQNNSNIDTGSVSPYKDYLQQIGFADSVTSAGLITDVVMTSSGTSLFLQEDIDRLVEFNNISTLLSSTAAATTFASGSNITAVENPKMFLMGHKRKDFNIIDFNSNPYKWSSPYENTLNEDVRYNLFRGHLNYAKFKRLDQFLPISGSANNKHFITTGRGDWNSNVGVNTINYESFESIYQKAKTPWIVSQPVNTKDLTNKDKSAIAHRCKKLFRFRTYSDGSEGNKYRFRIKPRRLGDTNKTEPFEKWSLFDVVVYYFNKYENFFEEILYFKNLNLDPNSDNYIGKQIGTEHDYYDISSKKIITEGLYLKTNEHVYVEIDDDVEYEKNISTLIPSGFMPYARLNHDNLTAITDGSNGELNIRQNPIQFVGNALISEHNNDLTRFRSEYPWGVLFDKSETILIKHTKNNVNAKFYLDKNINFNKNEKSSFYGYTKYFQNFKTAGKRVWIEDLEDNSTDIFNNFFHLEKIRYCPAGTNLNEKWNYSYYQRDGAEIVSATIEDNIGYEYVNVNDVLSSSTQDDSKNARFLSFDFFSFGGFDGVNILDDYKRQLTQYSVAREHEEEISGAKIGQTYYAYKIGHDLASNETNCRVDFLCLPGITSPKICKDFSIKAENERNYIYLFDIPEYGEFSSNVNDEYDDYTLSLIRDSYYFKNIDSSTTSEDQLDERDNIKSYLQTATDSTLNNFLQLFIDSKYAVGLLNTTLASYTDVNGNVKRIESPATLPYITSIVLSDSVSRPIDSILPNNNNILTYTTPINEFYNFRNNKFDALILDTKNINISVNPIVNSNQNNIKFNSSNNLLKNNKSLLRLNHNSRIYLYLVRNIKYILTVQPLINGNSVLFSNFSSQNSIVNVKAIINLTLIQFFEDLVDRNVIRDYSIDLNFIETRRIVEDKYNNILRGTIAVSLYGQPDNNIINLDLENLLNDIKDFTEENGSDIIKLDL